MLEGLKAYLKRFPAVVGIHRAIRNTRVHRAISNIRNDWRDVWDTFLASRCLLLQTTTRYGFKFHTGNSNTHREMLIGTFEPEEMGLVESHLSGAQVFVDVGANIGLYTCLARSRGRHTIAIEPQQKNLSILYFNLRENLYNDVEVYPLGLSDQPGITVLYGASGTSASLISGWSGGEGRDVAFAQPFQPPRLIFFWANGLRASDFWSKLMWKGPSMVCCQGLRKPYGKSVTHGLWRFV